MTREEAIAMMQVYKEELAQRVDNIKYALELRSIYLEQIKAFDMAIKALQAEPNKAVPPSLAYEPDKCDGHYCPGDCDLCNLEGSEDESRSKDTI